MASVEIENVDKSYGSTQVIRDVSVSVPDGAFVVLVGPSGCGKSTLLRMIAGLEEITDGTIRIGRAHHQRCRAEVAQHRHGVPELRALSAHDGRGEHGLLAAPGAAP